MHLSLGMLRGGGSSKQASECSRFMILHEWATESWELLLLLNGREHHGNGGALIFCE